VNVRKYKLMRTRLVFFLQLMNYMVYMCIIIWMFFSILLLLTILAERAWPFQLNFDLG
jgi:hypothetical protein